MIHSMTGFGRGQAAWQDGAVIVELRSVNHRFLEVTARLPRGLGHLEEWFKKAVQQRCFRGRVDVTVTVHGAKGGPREVVVDQSLAKQYHRALSSLKRSLKLGGSIDLAMVTGLREIVSLSEQPADDPKLARLVQRLLRRALDELEAMRAREGAALAEDMSARLATIKTVTRRVADRAPSLAQEAFGRMKDRVEKVLGAEAPDLPRLHQELAVYADRCDITEELVRLDSHMLQFGHSLKRRESVGKTLEFLLQEMGREVNTIGSKANHAEVAADVVLLKAEIEKLREQIQNVE